jgi:hypothetical protein
MKRTMIRGTQVALVAMAVAVGLFGSVKVSPTTPGSMVTHVHLITQAYAIIGRPLTPMSYAGVARRSAVGVGVGVAVGVGAAAVVAAPACAQVVDVYGRITTVCR